MRVSAEIVLPVPAEGVWEVLTDWERQVEWMKDADSVRVLTSHREGVGVRIGVKTRVLNVPAFTEVLEVIEWEPPARLLMGHRSFIRGTGEWKLKAAVEGSRFTWTEDISLPVPLLGELALIVYRPFMRYLMRAAVQALREALQA